MNAHSSLPNVILPGSVVRREFAALPALALSGLRRWWFSLTPQTVVGTATVLGLSLSLGFTVLLTYRSQTQLTESSRGLLHILQIEDRVQRLLGELNRADAAMRGYVLTRRDEYLAPLESNRDAVAAHFEGLRTLTAGDVRQEARLDYVRAQIDAQIDYLAQVVSSVRAREDGDVLKLLLSEQGLDLGHAVRESTAAFVEGERQTVAVRQKYFSGRTQAVVGWLSFFVVANVAGVVGLLALVHRMSRMHRFVKVCAWSRSIEFNGEWLTFEQYLAARFDIHASHGISPAEAEKMMRDLPTQA